MENILSGENCNGKVSQEEMKAREQKAEVLFKEFLETLGYDVDRDANMSGTPHRVVKMYMKEVFSGTYEPCPKLTTFPNDNKYHGIVLQKNIDVKSMCSHHFMPFRGKCHVAYVPGETVIGLSKLNRVVEWFCRRPQLQERLTKQIHDFLEEVLKDAKGIAVIIEAEHTCVSHRGINQDSEMNTMQLSGVFLDNNDRSREELYQMIKK